MDDQVRNRRDLTIGSAVLYYRLLTGSFFWRRGERREIGKDDKSKDGESFGNNKGIASCSVSYDSSNDDDLLLT